MKHSRNTVIFDLDGTLLNTLGDLHYSFNYALKTYGYKERTIEEIRNFVGSGIKKAMERAVPQPVTEDELKTIIDCFKGYYQENMYVYTKPYDGILDMLETLKQRGYKLGVVSNKYDAAVKKLCGKYFADYIDIAIGEGNGIRRKPETDGINKAVWALNSKIENTVYSGDSEVDIQTAKNAQIPCISVLWGFKDKEFLVNNGAQYLAQKPEDIISILET